MAVERTTDGKEPWESIKVREKRRRLFLRATTSLTSGTFWWPVLYVALLAISMRVVCSYYYPQLDSGRVFSLPGDYAQKFVGALHGDLHAPAPHAASSASPHQQLGTDDSIVKMEIVVVLSALWFSTFKTVGIFEDWFQDHRKHRRTAKPKASAPPGQSSPLDAIVPLLLRVVLALIASWPALLFAHQMIDVYEPAVLVMALVAILVAAEHYAGLEKSEARVEAATQTIERVNRQNDILLDAQGLSTYKRELYRLYCDAEYRIDAVVRHIDIDEIWWTLPQTHDPWGSYWDRAATDETTLYGALMRSKASFQYVAPMPLPPVALKAGPTAGLIGPLFFRQLMGLAWQCVVLAEVTRRAPSPPARYARIRIVETTAWMHVVDKTTYQVLQRGAGMEPSARKMTQEDADDDSLGRISDWARRNIRRIAHRGSPAEEYLDAMLAWAALFNPPKVDPAVEEDRRQLQLDGLGMQQFLSSAEGRKEAGLYGPARCLAIFRRYCELRREHRRIGGDDPEGMPL